MAPGIPLVIYNAPYDLTVVDRETRRHKMTPFADALAGHAVMVIDPLVLDKHVDQYRKGKRTLTAACDHYGVTLDGAHDSSFDALAAMRVAWKIAVTYPSIATMTLAGLHDLQEKAKADQAAGFQDYLRRQGKDEVIDGAWPYRPFGGDQ
jgi:DNA polymerase-3 subunit epsilon